MHDDGRTIDVREHGATPGGESNTGAIQAAIDACSGAGGGTVTVLAGEYHTGTIHLRDGVTLWLSRGATLCGSTDYDDLEEGHLLEASDVSDVGIEGPGTIGARGEAFWEYAPEANESLPAVEGAEYTTYYPESFGYVPQYDYTPLDSDSMVDQEATMERGDVISLHDCTDVTVRGVFLRNTAR